MACACTKGMYSACFALKLVTHCFPTFLSPDGLEGVHVDLLTQSGRHGDTCLMSGLSSGMWCRSPSQGMGFFYVQGLVTIRAYGASEWFISKVEEDLDANGKWWFAFMGLARWVGFRLDCLSAGTLLVGSVLAMLLRHKVIAPLGHLMGLALRPLMPLLDIESDIDYTSDF